MLSPDFIIYVTAVAGCFSFGWFARRDYEASLRRKRREFHARQMIHRI